MNPNRIRIKRVMQLTGWKRAYVAKLQAEGVIRSWQPYGKAWHWYDEKQILAVLNNGVERKNK